MRLLLQIKSFLTWREMIQSVDRIPLYRCSRCRIVSYCSKECQVKDWKNHRAFCVIDFEWSEV